MTTSLNAGRNAAAISATSIEMRYANRITDLLQWADEDGIESSKESIAQFWNLSDRTAEFGEASLIMTDAGDIRARWGDRHGPRLELEFLSDNRVEYVLVTDNDDDGRLQWNAAICPIAEIGSILKLACSAGVKSVWQNDGYPTATPC